ncbi:MAG: sulfatase-like hydrolase/transferase [Acidobacteriota bacterium]|nr:sulfatase-like hydrolase/transferase [Acidobacteriota bacterium]
MMRRSYGVLLAAILAFPLLSCNLSRPSILLISVDSLRLDAAFGRHEGKPIAPRLTAFADQSLVFDQAISPAPWTTPAMMAVMTGHDAPTHGVEKHYQSLSRSVPTLAERFRASGYRTAAFTPAVTLRAEYGFDRGFEIFDYEPYGHDKISSPALSGKVIHRLEQWKKEPFFIWVHLWDPHYNYNPPTPYDEIFSRGERPPSLRVQCLKWIRDPVTAPQALFLQGLFWGEVRYTDRYVGEILDALEKQGLASRTVVAILADHGEAFMEHHWLGHTNRLDSTLIHVPLMLRYPSELRPSREHRTVSTAQLGASLLALAGLPREGFGSLPPLPLDTAESPRASESSPPGVLSQTVRRGCLTSLTRERWRYVIDHHDCREELFDLEEDPGETVNLAEREPRTLASMRQAMRQHLERARTSRVPRASLPSTVLEESETRLRSLGYMAAGGGGGTRRGDPTVCDGVIFAGPRDSLGDMEPEECPPEGAMGCLERFDHGNSDSRTDP